MSTFWDSLSRSQEVFAKYKKTSGAFNADKKINFGLSLDLATNAPDNPTYYARTMDQAKQGAWSFVTAGTQGSQGGVNNAIETGRRNALKLAGATLGQPAGIPALAFAGAAAGSVVPGLGTAVGAGLGTIAGSAMYGIAELDKTTNGKLGTLLMSGARGIRSNYAFINDVARHDAAMGILSTLGIIGAGALGVAAVIATGGAAAPAVAAGALAMYGAGKAERSLAERGTFDSISKDIKKSALFSQSAVGQERYNFGNDSMHVLSNVKGFKTLGDTNKGIGAILSGVINFVAEVGLSPDIKGLQLGGGLVRKATIGGITTKTAGPVVNFVEKITNEPARQAKRLVDDIDLHKRTAAGEKTAYSDVYKFLRENDAATIQERIEFRGNETGQIGIPFLAGKTDQEISYVMRISKGDATALDLLAVEHPSTFAQLVRYEGALEATTTFSGRRVAFGFTRADGSNIVLSKNLPGNLKIVENELADLSLRYLDLNKMLKLSTAMTDRTVSKIPGVEALRNDIAKQRAANKLGGTAVDLTTRETAAGKVMQKLYTENGSLGVIIRKVERTLDDAPHMTVNFNDMLTGSSRLRTTTRAAVEKQLIAPEEGRMLYNSFLSAKTEIEKLAVLEKYETRIFDQLGVKHGVPGSMVDLVLAEYINITRKNKIDASGAKATDKAYMIDAVGDAVQDPQLISQLANGHYLPDVLLLDKAFERYAKKMGEEAMLPTNLAIMGGVILDEFQSVWRNLTLARTGFPINIMRDSTLRAWGDGALFYMIKDLGTTALTNILKSQNTISEIRDWTKAATNKNNRIKYIRSEMDTRDAALAAIPAVLKRAKYDPADPKTITLEVSKVLDYQRRIQAVRNSLAAQEQKLVAGTPEKIVGRDTFNYLGYELPKGGSGQFGKISYNILRGKDDLRGLLSSTRDLDMASIRRDRTGGHVIAPTQFNEKLHLKSWENVLNNTLLNDDIAKMILGQKMTEKEILSWIKSPASGNYIQRFGYDPTLKRSFKYKDAEHIYNRVLNAVNQFAPDIKLWKPMLEGKLDVLALKKLYPTWSDRPTIITDLAEDLLGRRNATRWMKESLTDAVTWLATKPTSVLSYNPYFNVKYQHKLQKMIALSNSQGRKLSEMEQNVFEATARAHTIGEFKSKINAFSRDMNYPDAFKHILAFFPAIVEQFRAYGKITMENPEFPAKIVAMQVIPDYLGDVKTDQYGTDYVEVYLPTLGINGRLPTKWFDAVNPTGGHIISAGPLGAAAVNVIAQQVPLPKYFTDLVLPFGVQANLLTPMTPNTVRKASQLYEAYFKKNGAQLNKDINMFMEQHRFEFEQKYHVKPNAADITNIEARSRKDATHLSAIRFIGSGILPAQPSYVTPLQVYADLLGKYNTQYGQLEGPKRFSDDYPDYYLLADSLTDSTSGIRSDDTAVTLVKKNPDFIKKMASTNIALTQLGAIFNDDNYAFSSSAQAWLTSNNIPGTSKAFKGQGEALANQTSSIVTNGWFQWNKMIEVTTQELLNNDPPYDVTRGYGAAVLDKMKQGFMDAMKTQNNLWYEEKVGAGFQKRQYDTIQVITAAANTPALWADLAKQPRWHAVIEYMNFRYEIYDALKARGTTLGTAKATDLAIKARAKVAELRKSDINFGKFYDRYFDGDDFSYVYDEQPAKGK